MTLHVQLRHKKVVETAIVLLALIVVALTGYFAWRAYDQYRGVRDVSRYADLADAAMRTVATVTLERGLTAALIGGRGREDAVIRDRLADTRRQADRLWEEMLALAETAPDAALLKDALAKGHAARRAFEAARAQVGREAGVGSAPIDIAQWMEDSTRFVVGSVRLGELAMQAADMGGTEIGFYSVPRKIVWEMSDQAGQERAILAYFIAARIPVTVESRERLMALRSRTRFGLEQVALYFDVPDADPRIVKAVSGMQENYLGRFESLRATVYAALGTGKYPLSASEWIVQVTDAIGSIHAIFDAITVVTHDRVERVRQVGMLWLVASLALLALSLGLVVASLTRVRSLVEDVFRQKDLAEVTMDSIGDAVVTTDVEGRVEYLNPVAEEMTGWTHAEAGGKPLREVFNIVNGYNREPKESPVERCLRDGHVVGLGNDTVLIRRDASESVIEDSAAPVRDRHGKVVGAVMVFYNVAAQRGNTHLMSYHATHDRLTGLVNRAEFERRLQAVLEQTKSRGGQHALCYLDLDQFKLVNDTCGHAAGDQLLRQLTKQLQTRVRDVDTLSHLGSDEFGLLLVGCPLDKAIAVAESLLRLVHDFRFEWRGSAFNLGASVGVVPITPENDNAGEVLAKADSACFAAKEKGRNRIQVYEPGDLEYAHRHGEMQWVARLNQALAEDRLRLYCQPIVPLRANYPTHYEILLRLADEQGQIVLPGEFLPAAERYNLISQIDRWVVRHTLSALKQVLPPKPTRRSGVACNINLSGASIGEASFLDELCAELEAAALPPGAVCFEITETAAVSNLGQATKLIRALKSRGCTLALDDFGTGLCSFSYLRDMQVDFLKIGGQFVKEIARDPTARAAVQAINTVGHTLHMRTVAEHVSSPKILEWVRKIGVDYAQGFALGKPMPVEECMLKHYRPTASAARAKTAPAGRRPKAG